MARIRTPANQTIIPKPHVQALANALEAEFGLTNFGTYLGHSPPEGPTQAIDIFTPDNPEGWAMQDRVLAYVRDPKNQKRFAIRYHIRRIQIWNIERDSEGLRNQTRTGNRTADHMDHGHNTQYDWAPGPFGKDGTTSVPDTATTLQGGDMLIINVQDTGIFLLRGNHVQHLQHPDHVMDFVRAGVPYQDKVNMPKHVFESYLPINQNVGVREAARGLVSSVLSTEEEEDSTVPYDEMVSQVQAKMEAMKQEYYDMMLENN